MSRLPWLLLAAAFVLAGCGDVNASATVPDHVTFSTVAPGALAASAKAALAKMPPDTGSVEHGVVLSETTSGFWYARVLIGGGVAVLDGDGSCSPWEPDDWWREQVQPGDSISWSPKGNHVCPGQVHVVTVGGGP